MRGGDSAAWARGGFVSRVAATAAAAKARRQRGGFGIWEGAVGEVESEANG